MPCRATSPRLLLSCTAFCTLLLTSFSVSGQDLAELPFRQIREKHRTKLTYAPAKPPAAIFNLIKYQSPAGAMSAYVTPDPGDGKKHPIILWLVGGFSNSIGDHLWAAAREENDQSAAAYRKAGLLMMFPSLRGGIDNPGRIEVCCGEVDDVIAAAKHAATLPYVDPSRIYLGGHSTGDTLALLVAGSTDLFRAVISYGPIHSVAGYGEENLPFDATDNSELIVRAPILCLPAIKSPAFVLEGTDGNIEALQRMAKLNKNPHVRFHEVAGTTHFNILAPFNRLFAEKLMADKGAKCELTLTADEIKNTAAKAKQEN